MKSQLQAGNRNSFDTFAKRFSLLREKRGVSLGSLAGGKPSTAKSWESGTMPRNDLWEGIAAKLGVSVSLLFLGHPKTAADYDFIAKYADEIAMPAAAKGGDNPARVRVSGDGPHTMVASRISPAPGAPSSRADCENYFAELLDEAERSGNPNAFPVIHDRLKKKFPIAEWQETKTTDEK